MQVKKFLAAALSAALLAGCASVSQKPVADYRDTFDAAGRLTVNYPKDGNQEQLTGNFSWSQTPGRIDVSLSSPMATIARITITPESATLVQADKTPRTAKDIDTLTAQELGWSLPVSGLRDWLQGYATGADGKRFAASPANNIVTTGDGWRLRFVTWQDETAAHPVPKRIDAERNASATADQLSIRIVINPQG